MQQNVTTSSCWIQTSYPRQLTKETKYREKKKYNISGMVLSLRRLDLENMKLKMAPSTFPSNQEVKKVTVSLRTPIQVRSKCLYPSLVWLRESIQELIQTVIMKFTREVPIMRSLKLSSLFTIILKPLGSVIVIKEDTKIVVVLLKSNGPIEDNIFPWNKKLRVKQRTAMLAMN